MLKQSGVVMFYVDSDVSGTLWILNLERTLSGHFILVSVFYSVGVSVQNFLVSKFLPLENILIIPLNVFFFFSVLF